jgi:glycine hydroxymethyltransferase
MRDESVYQGAIDELRALLQLRDQHDRDLTNKVILYAGTNITSPLVDESLSWGWGSMPAMGQPFHKDQPGTEHISKLETIVERQLRDLFLGAWAEARLPTCTMANAAIFHAFGRNRRLMLSAPAANGGHVSARADGTPGLSGLTVDPLPYRLDGFTIDDDAAAHIVLERPPAILLLGCSITLHVDLPPKTIAAARSVGTIVVYDASHVAGLIAGGAVANPLREGAHILTASTYKSLGGPPGGILVGVEEIHAQEIKRIVCPLLSSNYDAGRLPALSIALTEAKAFMLAYAAAMIDAARLLRDSLQDRGIRTVPRKGGIQQTHQFLIPVGDYDKTQEMMRAFEAVGIIVGANILPPGNEFCLRVGAQVLARLGYGSEALEQLANVMAMLLNQQSEPGLLASVANLAGRHRKLKFALTLEAGGIGLPSDI